MGGWLCNIMLLSLLVRWRRNQMGADHVITENHFHDIGKLCFGFTAFWGYLTFSQYLVIWYGNMGEETHWPRLPPDRAVDAADVSAVIIVFVLPFFGLLARTRRSSRRRWRSSRPPACSASGWSLPRDLSVIYSRQ